MEHHGVGSSPWRTNRLGDNRDADLVWDDAAWVERTGAPTMELAPIGEIGVPVWQSDVLPDGRVCEVLGDVKRLAEQHHRQGDNPYLFRGTCGLCCCEAFLRRHGIDVTEADLVRHAVRGGLCSVSHDPEKCGGTTAIERVRILADYGVAAHIETADSLDELTGYLQRDLAVMISANAGVLWNNADYYGSGQVNHAVVVTGAARDPVSGRLQGFFINDSGSGAAGRFVDAATMREAWLETGGMAVVTDAPPAVRPAAGTPTQRMTA